MSRLTVLPPHVLAFEVYLRMGDPRDIRALSLACKSMLRLGSDLPLLARWMVYHRPERALIWAVTRRSSTVDIRRHLAEVVRIAFASPPDLFRRVMFGAKDDEGSRPLHLAAMRGHGDVAKVLIQCVGADVNVRNDVFETPLHLAAMRGHGDVAKVLIECGADVNVRNDAFETPLHLAAMRGHGDVAKILIQCGADVNVCRYEENETPLHLAAMRGHVDVAKVLIECGADVNVRRYEVDETPLHLAAMQGHGGVAKILIECGADVNARECRGHTPLHCCALPLRERWRFGKQIRCARSEKSAVVRMLLNREDTDVNARCIGEQTPLHVAVRWQEVDVATALVEGSTRIDTRALNWRGNMPVHEIILTDREMFVALMRTGKVDVEARNADGLTHLDMLHNLVESRVRFLHEEVCKKRKIA